MKKRFKDSKTNKEITSLTKNKQERGSLIIVGTPIGNIGDFTIRAKQTLEEVDYILAEDTRNIKKLSMLVGFSYKKVIRYNENKRLNQIPKIIDYIIYGSNVALVSDAGMPLISDPGYIIVKECIKNNIEVKTVPGPSSIISSLVVSGLPTDSFYFVGFLPKKFGSRKSIYLDLINLKTTIIVLESPKRLLRLLEELKLFFGDIEIAVIRELTKLYEEVIRGEISSVINRLNSKTRIVGEIVVILSPLKNEDCGSLSTKEIAEMQNFLQNDSLKNVVNKMVYKTGKPRNIVYKEALKINLVKK